MWAYEGIFYQIYPIGFCGAPTANDGKTVSRILKLKDWSSYLDGQTILSLDTQTIEKYLDKLEAKTTVGELLAVKAQAQGLKLVDIPEADEIYTREWALNTAAVTKLLLGD